MATYGLGFNSVNLGSDIYITFVLTAFIEIPSYIFLVLVVDGLGRKPVLIFCQVVTFIQVRSMFNLQLGCCTSMKVLAGVTCTAAGFTDVSWITTTLTLAGKPDPFCSSFCTNKVKQDCSTLHQASSGRPPLSPWCTSTQPSSIRPPFAALRSAPALPLPGSLMNLKSRPL